MLMQNKIAHSSELSTCLKANSHSPGAGYDYQFLTPWLGQGLLTSSGPRWHGRRKLLTRAFHGHILDQHVAAMQGHVARLCDKLEVHAQEGTTCSLLEGVTSKSTLTISILYLLVIYCVNLELSLCTLDIICDTVMGQHVGAQEDATSPYVRAVVEVRTRDT